MLSSPLKYFGFLCKKEIYTQLVSFYFILLSCSMHLICFYYFHSKFFCISACTFSLHFLWISRGLFFVSSIPSIRELFLRELSSSSISLSCIFCMPSTLPWSSVTFLLTFSRYFSYLIRGCRHHSVRGCCHLFIQNVFGELQAQLRFTNLISQSSKLLVCNAQIWTDDIRHMCCLFCKFFINNI